MKEKTILIIGAGVAGLAAGCYGQMNGYRTKIFELHNLPGGLCTAWERKGYVFDGCIHYLFGSGEGQPFHQMWQELGAIQDRPMIDHDEYQRITDDDQTLVVYTDPDRLETHMSDLSPADAPLIRSFARGIRQFMDFDVSLMFEKPKPMMNLWDWQKLGIKMTPFLGPLMQCGPVSAGDFARRFKNPFLRRAVGQMFSWKEAPMMMGLMLLAYMQRGNASFPVGASLEFSRALERRYLELGGEIHYKSQVEKILTENGRAVGLRLYNDDVITGDIVISAADGRGTIFDMLDGEYTNSKLRRIYDGHLPIHSMLQISMGVNRDLSAEPHWVTHLLNKPALIAGQEHHQIGVKHYCFDQSLAPQGKSVLELIIPTKYAYWQRIYGRQIYDTEQTQVSDIALDYLDKWHPGLRQQIEFTDEATPLSYERYTGNWQGSTCGWLLTKQTMPMMMLGVPKTLPGLQNFYMAGQWVEPGGSVAMCAASGRGAIQMICQADKIPFHAFS
jgi:phytoene dehydrogenase-like protein